MASPKKQKGWTLMELTVVMVILAFLHAYDKMSDVGAVATKSSAIQRTDNLKYLHGTYLNNHVLSNPSAPFPGMGDLVGYAPVVPGNPQTAPMLYDEAWWPHYFYESGIFSWWHCTGSCATARPSCDSAAIFSAYTIDAGYQIVPHPNNPTPTGAGLKGSDSAVDCSLRYFRINGGITYGPYNLNGYGSSFPAPPQQIRMTCEIYQTTYGVPYTIKYENQGNVVSDYQGLTVGSYRGINGSSVSGKTAKQFYATTYAVGALLDAHCEASSLTPDTPAKDGEYPMAADFSGYCVADGWKIGTYKDANGTTPTTAATDPVGFIAAAPEEDATNCPKGPVPKP
jgi:hypothetical protein